MIRALCGAVLACAAFGTHAQSPAADNSLYLALGEKPGLVRLMDVFVESLRVDPRTAALFKEANTHRLKAQLVDQVCQLSGGPCQYRGADMKTAHANLDIRKSDFNALVEDLEKAMQAQGIPFSAQRRLLALLAPMHRDAITVH
jgi:hemoglobin